jgi:fatty-acyl-CoA synthase
MAPDRVAFVQGEMSYTYAETAHRVDALAAGLHGLGVRSGDRVAYLGPNDVATFTTLFATARLGAIFVPLNTRLSGPEIAYLLTDSGAKVLVYGPESASLAAAADPRGRGVATVVRLSSSGDAVAADVGVEEVIAAGSEHAVPDIEVGLGDDALILYTSGTTGRPKGAVLTHQNLTFNTVNQLAHVDVLGSDVVLCTAPLFHVTGLGQVSLPTIFKGGTVVMAPKFDPAWMLATIAAKRITAFSAVPTMLQLLCDHPDFATSDLSSLRYVIYGGSPALDRVATAWFARGVAVLHGYGMTEAAPGVTLATPDGANSRPTSAGVLHFFTDALVAENGELLVRGPNVFRGYWNRPQETEASFQDGWFRSGDVVRFDDGWSYVVDRVKDMIISGGENIYPAEVEDLIAELPQVSECAVVAVPDDRWGEVGLAFVVLTEGAELDAATLVDQLAGRLAKFKIPKHVRFVGSLPRTATGKIRKADLRAAALMPHPPLKENL